MSKKKDKNTEKAVCPCGGHQEKKPFAECCEPYLLGQEQAPDAERLMRSRYSAYVHSNEHYLLNTWHPSTRPTALDLETAPPQWLGLTVHEFHEIDADHQEVSFTAKYKQNGKAFKMHENSRFVKEDGKWFYFDGDVVE
ncbi:hypothetical protein KU392_07465 [Advenella alkanexedens]|jgi:SEC-C motif-containing protein|uniref:UPF0225 protein KU392_07465 n=1 Tax=Advenella alkanexedens TaxID=1481665 RepID=A0ABS6NNY0_9BURK|nr:MULTISPECIES: YchJ family metal-binding protein [Advenella]MBV4397084.1 hypothetical protein [Advenella alkanexedens]NLN67773.1 hypothetical protein [Alcaligenaceae bacterium]WKU20446.1 YchJ family metal-binding protein [Advenella alkanexedens]